MNKPDPTDPVFASFSLTHVHYNPNDPVSYLCAWLALIPQGLCVVYVTLIWSSREIEILLMFIGQLACECINFCLKRIIREERPREMHGKGYGMPSSHAQFVSFFSVYLTLFLLLRHKGNTHPKAAHTPMSLRRRTVLCVEALGWAGAVAWSRIYLSYHTPKQVMVGALAGTICAFGWFFMTTVFRRSGLLHYALALPPVRYFRFRDLVVEEDIAQAGWEKWEERRLRAASQNGTKDKRR